MSRFTVSYFGNSTDCRTEAEVVDSECPSDMVATCAVVYEARNGIETEILPRGAPFAADADFQSALERARHGLLKYVNRLGHNPPLGLSPIGLSLWLLEMHDGTSMGRKIS